MQGTSGAENAVSRNSSQEEMMKSWMKPQVREQEVGLEVTSYLPAEIDIV
jgi:coenzyme PQQ precursor peptide PqqA